MSNPIPPTFPVNTQTNNPIWPDYESESYELMGIPSWIAGSNKTQGYIGSLFANVFVSLDDQLETLKERLYNFSTSDPDQWSSLAVESPYYIVNSNRGVPFNNPDTFNTWSAEYTTIPFILNSDLQLTNPGILVSTISPSSGYFIPLPNYTNFIEEFWVQGYGPKVVNYNNNIYIRDINRVLLNYTNANSTSGTTYIPYLGDTATNYNFSNISSYANFDTPLSNSNIEYSSIYYRRGSNNIFNYNGATRLLESWTQYNNGIITPIAHVGDSISLSYISSGKNSILGNSIILFQGDVNYNNINGIVSGPFYPNDSKNYSTEVWGVPSQPFIHINNRLFSRLRNSETNFQRIRRLLILQKIIGIGNNSRNFKFRLSAMTGRLNPTIVTGSTVYNTDIFIPSLEGNTNNNITFTNTNPNTKYIENNTTVNNYPSLISNNILLKRNAGINFGGYVDINPSTSKFSPFSRSSLPSTLVSDLPIPTDSSYNISYNTNISPVIVNLQNNNTVTLQTNHPNYVASISETYITPGTIDYDTPVEAFTDSIGIKPKCIQDAYLRGDYYLRGPDKPTQQWLSLTNRSYTALWNTVPINQIPIANNASLDLDIEITLPIINTSTYGTGPNVPNINNFYNPLASDYI